MPDSIYLAMTAAEIDAAESLPERPAYMACHFSPYGTGLSNFPVRLPENSILMVNDRTPICGHDKELICRQLTQLLEQYRCNWVLLDLQRPDEPESRQLAAYLCDRLEDKIAVSDLYAQGLSCPVFLPPLPVGQSLSDHISPWAGREVWLDICCDAVSITVTGEGSTRSTIPCCDPDELPFCHDALHCGYKTQVFDDRAVFTLCRNATHLPALIKEGKDAGITHFIGLHQELKTTRK